MSAENDIKLSYEAHVAGYDDVAIMLARRAIATNQNDGAAWGVLGNYLITAGLYNEAGHALHHAHSLIGDVNWSMHHDIAWLCYATGRMDDAIYHYERLLKLKDTPVNRQDYAQAVLKSGDLKRGMELFEARWETVDRNTIWDSGLPLWNGEQVGGNIIIHEEQGYGDTLQFVRFIPEIAKRSASHIVFAVRSPLIRLLKDQCGIDEIIDIDDQDSIDNAVTRADYHCPLMSAFSRLGHTYDTLPIPQPYLVAPGIQTEDLLDVGLVWAAKPGTRIAIERSVPLREMLGITTIPGVQFWSLQGDTPARQLSEIGAHALVRDVIVHDFADTAVIMNQLDLVVTVDTAAAHLAGALGRPVFLITALNDCWRWARGAEPWYPTMKIFKQKRSWDWKPTLIEIKREIEAMVK